jgi:hypothetical protein
MTTEDNEYRDALADLESGECATINDKDEVFFCGKYIGIIKEPDFRERPKPFQTRKSGVFPSLRVALSAIKEEAEKAKYFPNVYRVNDHGNIDLIHPTTGKIIRDWV